MTRKNIFLFLSFSFLFHFHSLSQDTLYPRLAHSIYVELGGAALVYSVNYDCVLIKKTLPDFALRVGGEILPYSNDAYQRLKKQPSTVLSTPIEILVISNYINAFELGVGFCPSFGDRFYYSISSPSPNSGYGYIIHYNFDMMPFFQVGYRFQSPKQHFIFRINFTEIFLSKTFLAANSESTINRNRTWAGIAFGYCLK